MAEQSEQPGARVVLGATGAVGTVLARKLAQAGPVFVAGRNEEALAALAAELDVPSAHVDAAEPATIEAALQHAAEAFGSLSGVANCIGSLLLKPAHTTTDEEWHDTLQTNLTSCFATLRASGKLMRKTGGSVVLVSSVAATMGLANHEAISAAKAGVVGLMHAASASYAGYGIRVNAVAPGLVKSHMTRRLWENESSAEASRGMHALGRLGEPEDVASAIAWLLDPQSEWVTGQVIGVDGGLGSVLPRPTAKPRG